MLSTAILCIFYIICLLLEVSTDNVHVNGRVLVNHQSSSVIDANDLAAMGANKCSTLVYYSKS